jgi:CHAD domain-containing protein
MAQPNVEEVLDLTSPARELLHRRVVALRRELLVRDQEMRNEIPDAVHQTRVTCRRMRAALATFGSLLRHRSGAGRASLGRQGARQRA